MHEDTMRLNAGVVLLGLAAVSVLAGCGAGDTGSTEGVVMVPARPPKNIRPNADAGIEVPPSQDGNRFRTLVASSSPRFPTRPDPFALTRRESGFERRQLAERVFMEGGQFDTMFPPPQDPPVIVPVLEPQPYRRLSGIVVGDSVLALIEMNDGNPPLIIRPGMRIPNTPWRVISIDEEKAILRRDDNVQPRQITVRLEVPPPGMGGGGPNPGGPDDGGGLPGGGGDRGPGGAGDLDR